MSDSCCSHGCATPPASQSPRYRRVLWAALVINAVMFAVELAGGLQAGSVSLLAELAIMMVLSAFGFFDGLREMDRNNPSIEVIANAMREQGGLWFAAAAAIVAIKGVLWFTAALMAHQPMPASHAIRWSFFALIGNIIPLTLFAFFMFGLMFMAMLPWFLGMLVFVPIYAIAHYTSFKAVFRADAERADGAG